MEKNQMEYEMVYNSFRDEVLHKQMLIDKLQYQFNSKISGSSRESFKNQTYFVKFCRSMIEEFDRIYGDIRSYFVEIKLDFAYETIYRIFKMCIHAFKVLSQYFVRHLKTIKLEPPPTFHSIDIDKSETNQQEKRKQLKKKHMKEIEHINFVLRDIQEEERKIIKEKQQAQKYFFNKKQSIQNTGPSEAIPQLEQLKRNIDRIVENSERMFDQNYLHRHQELRNRILTVKTPAEIDQIFKNQIFSNMKLHFSTAIQNAITTLYKILKNREKQNLARLQALQRANQKHMQTQTIEFKIGGTKKTAKQIDNFIIEYEIMKKQNLRVMKCLKEANQQIAELKQMKNDQGIQIKTMENILKKKNSDINQLKLDSDSSLNRKEEAIQILQNKIKEMKKEEVQRLQAMKDQAVECNEREFSKQNQLFPQMEMLADNFSEIQISYKSKLNSSRGKNDKIQGMHLQRELKIHKSQNSLMRKSLTVIIGKLNQKQLIFEYPLNNLDDDIKSKALEDKIENMKMEIEDKLKIYIEKRVFQQIHKNKQFQEAATQANFNQKLNERPKNRISIESVPRNTGRKNTTRFYLNIPSEQKFSNSAWKISPKKQQEKVAAENHLQKLKKELVDRIQSRKNSSKFKIKHSNKNLTIDDKSLQMCPHSSSKKDLTLDERKTEKKQTFLPKDISFEQLNFTKNKNAGQSSSPSGKRDKNSQDAPIEPKSMTKKYIENQIPMISADNMGNWTDANKILHYVELKNDSKDHFFKNFMKSLMMEVRKRKGDRFVKEAVSAIGRNSGVVRVPKEIIFQGETEPKSHDKKLKNSDPKKSNFSPIR